MFSLRNSETAKFPSIELLVHRIHNQLKAEKSQFFSDFSGNVNSLPIFFTKVVYPRALGWELFEDSKLKKLKVP